MDERYNSTRILIEAGYITSIAQIFVHIPITVVFKELGGNYIRLLNCVNDPSKFTLDELFALAQLFQVDELVIILMAYDNMLQLRIKKFKKKKVVRLRAKKNIKKKKNLP